MTQSAVIPMSKAEQMLAKAVKPEESRHIEQLAQAARAYAKEQNDYEAMVTAVRIYALARRRTTELILPYIKQGRPNNHDNDVHILADFNLTPKQWDRRTSELSIGQDVLETYFDDCVAKGWNPSIAGLLRASGNGGLQQSNASKIYHLAVRMIEAGEYRNEDERIALLGVVENIKP